MHICSRMLAAHSPTRVISGVTTLGLLLCLINMQQIETFVAHHSYRTVHSLQENVINAEDPPSSKLEMTVKPQLHLTCPIVKCPTPTPISCLKTECVCSSSPSLQGYKVPNIVHYEWYHSPKTPMTFRHYLAILSAHKALKPEKIYIHMNISHPSGRYWDKIVRLDSVVPLNEGLPRELLGIKLIPDTQVFPTDSADIGRIKYLLQYGGIYLDYDTLIIKSFNDLRRKYEFTLIQDQAVQISYGLLSNSVIMSSPTAAFLYLWANSYLEGFKPRQWSYNLIQKPTTLLKRFPHAVHLTKESFYMPIWKQDNIDHIWGNKTLKWRELYAVNIPYRHLRNSQYYRRIYSGIEPDENNIVYMNNSFAEIARHILSLNHMKVRD